MILFIVFIIGYNILFLSIVIATAISIYQTDITVVDFAQHFPNSVKMYTVRISIIRELIYQNNCETTQRATCATAYTE